MGLLNFCMILAAQAYHMIWQREREREKKANIKLTIILNKLTHFRNLTSLAISGIFKVSISSI